MESMEASKAAPKQAKSARGPKASTEPTEVPASKDSVAGAEGVSLSVAAAAPADDAPLAAPAAPVEAPLKRSDKGLFDFVSHVEDHKDLARGFRKGGAVPARRHSNSAASSRQLLLMSHPSESLEQPHGPPSISSGFIRYINVKYYLQYSCVRCDNSSLFTLQLIDFVGSEPSIVLLHVYIAAILG